MSEEPIVLNETIHQSTRLRIMTLLVSLSESDRVAYGFVKQTLGLTGGNLTIHLRKLEGAGYVRTTKEFLDRIPRTWVKATLEGRRAFTEYLGDLENALNVTFRSRSHITENRRASVAQLSPLLENDGVE